MTTIDESKTNQFFSVYKFPDSEEKKENYEEIMEDVSIKEEFKVVEPVAVGTEPVTSHPVNSPAVQVGEQDVASIPLLQDMGDLKEKILSTLFEVIDDLVKLIKEQQTTLGELNSHLKDKVKEGYTKVDDLKTIFKDIENRLQ